VGTNFAGKAFWLRGDTGAGVDLRGDSVLSLGGDTMVGTNLRGDRDVFLRGGDSVGGSKLYKDRDVSFMRGGDTGVGSHLCGERDVFLRDGDSVGAVYEGVFLIGDRVLVRIRSGVVYPRRGEDISGHIAASFLFSGGNVYAPSPLEGESTTVGATLFGDILFTSCSFLSSGGDVSAPAPPLEADSTTVAAATTLFGDKLFLIMRVMLFQNSMGCVCM